jgi:hypothetical protein
MPEIHPHGWRELLDSPAGTELPLARRRELETLARLAAGLEGSVGKDIAIYHGVHWTRLEDDRPIFDDIDFVIVGPTGRILLIEQASGFLEERPSGLVRRQSGREITVAARLAEARSRFEGRLRRALAGSAVPPIDLLFHCPDYTVRDGGTAGLPPERIVDASRRDELPAVVMTLVEGPAGDGIDRPRVHRFMADLLGLSPDTSAIIGAAQALTTRLSGGLAEWARRIDCSPFRLRVIGTAGSGKTQLAIAAYRDALAAGRRPLYVCYNRPLADHVGSILREGSAQDASFAGAVLTFHQLADRVARARGEVPDFAAPDAFKRLEAAMVAVEPDEAWRFDELIVDEGQDFEPAWADALLRMLRPGGRAWWLEDPMQNLYGREPFRREGWVELRSEINYRSPRTICSILERLLDQTVSSGCPIEGTPVEIIEYVDEPGMIEQTKRAIGIAIAAGFRRDAIAVLSFRGRERSRLAALPRIGPYVFHSFTGRYDLLGAPIHTEGEIAFDSVMRFKGRSAPCVVLTEVDFDTLDERARRRLFVGASRATLRLILVCAARSAHDLRVRLAPAD